jgi:hypothetical protein
MRKYRFKRFINALIITSLVMVMANFGYYAQAEPLTTLSDNLSRLKISELADHTIQFVTPTGVAAAETIVLTFDADFTMGSFSVDNVDLAEATTCGGSFTDKALAASPSGATWGVAQLGQVITFTSDTDIVTATHCVKIEIGANATFDSTPGATQITNPAAAQAATLGVTAGASDSGNAAIVIVDTNFDQVSVTATVDPTISFAVSDPTIGFGTLYSTKARYATGNLAGDDSETSAHNLTVSTNAVSGYTVYVLGATLTNVSNGSYTVSAIGGTKATYAIGTEQFGIQVTPTGGSGVADDPYDTASNYAYDAVTTQDIIGHSTIASATTTFAISYLGSVAATTEAGTYATTLTYTATGSF